MPSKRLSVSISILLFLAVFVTACGSTPTPPPNATLAPCPPPTNGHQWTNVGSYGFYAVGGKLIGSVVVLDDGRALVFEPFAKNPRKYITPGSEFPVEWGLVKQYYLDCSGNLWVDMNTLRPEPVVPPGSQG